ncbi:MAG: RloB domain-containing protein [Bacteroidales bacterium]|nr:RloB domain-containing protein [Bacteroidales bacterium]
MKKIKDPIAVIGEGVTEYYYLNSLKDKFRQINIKPSYPKHSTGLDYLEQEIDKAIDAGYSLIICVIDMDNKKQGDEKDKYIKFKNRLQGVHYTKKPRTKYEIRFVENERCTEIFFLFYFAYTTRCFQNQPELLKALNKKCVYEKTEEFFKKHSLHQYFEKEGGDFKKALSNAAKSMKEKEETGRDYTYSQMAELFDALGIKSE